MDNKIKDKRYDLPGFAPDTDDEAFSTDLDADVDPADTQIYHHYRLMQLRNEIDTQIIDEQLLQMKKLQKAFYKGTATRNDKQ